MFPSRQKGVLQTSSIACLIIFGAILSISFLPCCTACCISLSVAQSTWFAAFLIKPGTIFLNAVRLIFTESQSGYAKLCLLSQPPTCFQVLLVLSVLFCFSLNFSLHIFRSVSIFLFLSLLFFHMLITAHFFEQWLVRITCYVINCK